MDKMTTSIIAATGLILLFSLEAFVSKDFRNSFKASSLFRNISYIIASLIVLVLLGEISSVVKSTLGENTLQIHKIPILDYIGCFLFAELLNWLSHYIKHSGWLWRLHYPHHIDKRYTVLLTTQTHALDVICSGVIIGLAMSLVGFSIEAINTYYLFYTLANTYQHTSLNLSLGVLDYIIVSPRYHRIHHSKSHRSNYGSTITFWDIVFSTAYWPKRNEVKRDIGIIDNGEPFGFAKEMLYFLKIDPKKSSISNRLTLKLIVILKNLT
jgi:sterol desaturase/sphingolipid hydroxylase (fatty acid hydroxylase superfamily)